MKLTKCETGYIVKTEVKKMQWIDPIVNEVRLAN